MRTTLTLDDDVAARLERLRKTRNESLKDLVNEAKRQGLRNLEASTAKREPFVTQSVDLAQCLPGNVDDVAEVLAAGSPNTRHAECARLPFWPEVSKYR